MSTRKTSIKNQENVEKENVYIEKSEECDVDKRRTDRGKDRKEKVDSGKYRLIFLFLLKFDEKIVPRILQSKIERV